MILTLGLQTGHEASAALFHDRQLVAAISDERITRVKNDGGRLMDHATDAVLKLGGDARSSVDQLALLYTFFPDEYFVRETWAKELERRLVRRRRARSGAERPQMLLCNFLERLQARGKTFSKHFREDEFRAREGYGKARIAFYDHHATHAIAAAFFSGFPECAVVTMDGQGDWGIHHTSGVFRDGRYERLQVSDAPGASTGMFYGHITELLGFRPMRHEGKVVGLAALGDPEPLYEPFAKAMRLAPDGLTLTSDFTGPGAERRRLEHLRQAISGHSRENISAAAQQLLEDVALDLVRNFLRKTGLRHLALNGGVFANVKLNQRIAMLPEVDSIFVFPAMSDTGNSVGAALLDMAARDPEALKGAEPMRDVYLGPSYSDDEIAAELTRAGLPVRKLDEGDLIDTAARAIHDGRVVGWFQGRMEFGPRALGNRSMLARPTESAINDWLNERLDRSEFMPFAPSVLAEHADDLFVGVEKARHTAEFMTVTFDVNP